jgi:hypothetical protein
MDVIGVLRVSLGTCTVQLHNSLGSRCACACSQAGFSSQNGYRACEVYYWRAGFCCAFFVDKRTRCKEYTETFPVYGGKCLSRNSLQDVRKSQVMPDLERKWLRQQWKDFCAAGFDALVKRWDKCITVRPVPSNRPQPLLLNHLPVSLDTQQLIDLLSGQSECLCGSVKQLMRIDGSFKAAVSSRH